MKAILIIDEMPTDCYGCHLMVDGWCYAKKAREVQDDVEEDKRPDWCPLVYKPDKKNLKMQGDIKNELVACYARGKVDGWNECLEEIEGKR